MKTAMKVAGFPDLKWANISTPVAHLDLLLFQVGKTLGFRADKPKGKKKSEFFFLKGIENKRSKSINRIL